MTKRGLFEGFDSKDAKDSEQSFQSLQTPEGKSNPDTERSAKRTKQRDKKDGKNDVRSDFSMASTSQNSQGEAPSTPKGQDVGNENFLTPSKGQAIGDENFSTPENSSKNILKSLQIPKKIQGTESSARTWEKLFKGNLCIGENHDEIAAKKFLIQNMDRMKEEGFEVLILEHLTQEEHQKDVDNFFKNDSAAMSDSLEKWLAKLNKEHMTDSFFANDLFNKEAEKYNFTKIIEAAKENGLRVVCAERSLEDYQGESNRDGRNRMISLNSAIKKLVDDLDGKKWVAFVGSGHLNTRKEVPGICEIIEGVQDIVIKDVDMNEKEKANSLQVFQIKNNFMTNGGDKFSTSMLLKLRLDDDDATYEKITKNLYNKSQEKSTETNAVKYQIPDLNSSLRPFPSGGFARRVEDAEKNKSGNSR